MVSEPTAANIGNKEPEQSQVVQSTFPPLPSVSRCAQAQEMMPRVAGDAAPAS